jgi:hypothetical protein
MLSYSYKPDVFAYLLCLLLLCNEFLKIEISDVHSLPERCHLILVLFVKLKPPRITVYGHKHILFIPNLNQLSRHEGGKTGPASPKLNVDILLLALLLLDQSLLAHNGDDLVLLITMFKVLC